MRPSPDGWYVVLHATQLIAAASGNHLPNESARSNDKSEPAGPLPFLAERLHGVFTHPISGVEKQELLRVGVDSDNDFVMRVGSIVGVPLNQSNQDRAVPAHLTHEVVHLASDQECLQTLASRFVAERAGRHRLPWSSGRSRDLRRVGWDAPPAQDHRQRRGSTIVRAGLTNERDAAHQLPAILRPEVRC